MTRTEEEAVTKALDAWHNKYDNKTRIYSSQEMERMHSAITAALKIVFPSGRVMEL